MCTYSWGGAVNCIFACVRRSILVTSWWRSVQHIDTAMTTCDHWIANRLIACYGTSFMSQHMSSCDVQYARERCQEDNRAAERLNNYRCSEHDTVPDCHADIRRMPHAGSRRRSWMHACHYVFICEYMHLLISINVPLLLWFIRLLRISFCSVDFRDVSLDGSGSDH